jgi:hypothetical protein
MALPSGDDRKFLALVVCAHQSGAACAAFSAPSQSTNACFQRCS